MVEGRCCFVVEFAGLPYACVSPVFGPYAAAESASFEGSVEEPREELRGNDLCNK